MLCPEIILYTYNTQHVFCSSVKESRKWGKAPWTMPRRLTRRPLLCWELVKSVASLDQLDYRSNTHVMQPLGMAAGPTMRVCSWGGVLFSQSLKYPSNAWKNTHGKDFASRHRAQSKSASTASSPSTESAGTPRHCQQTERVRLSPSGLRVRLSQRDSRHLSALSGQRSVSPLRNAVPGLCI